MIYNYKKAYEGTKILSWLTEFLFICLVDIERDSIEEKDLPSLIWLGEAICKLLDYEASKKLFSFISSALVQNKNWMTCDFSLFLCLLLGRHLFLFLALTSRTIELCQTRASQSEWARTRVASPGFELKS